MQSSSVVLSTNLKIVNNNYLNLFNVLFKTYSQLGTQNFLGLLFMVGDSILSSIFKIKKTILHCVLVWKEFVIFTLLTLYIHCVSWHITTKRQLHFKSMYNNNIRDALHSCHERERTSPKSGREAGQSQKTTTKRRINAAGSGHLQLYCSDLQRLANHLPINIVSSSKVHLVD